MYIVFPKVVRMISVHRYRKITVLHALHSKKPHFCWDALVLNDVKPCQTLFVRCNGISNFLQFWLLLFSFFSNAMRVLPLHCREHGIFLNCCDNSFVVNWFCTQKLLHYKKFRSKDLPVTNGLEKSKPFENHQFEQFYEVFFSMHLNILL